MGTRELLTYLEKLEIGLSNFSYEELGTVEAGKLKRSFDTFKNGLENRVFGVSEMKQLDVIYEQIGIQGAMKPSLEDKTLTDTELLLSLISSLEDTPLTKKQDKIVKTLKETGQRLAMKDSNPIKSNMPLKTLQIEKNLESLLATHKVDLTPVLKECAGEMELLEELIRLYKQNIVEFIGSLKINLNIENFRGVEFACQKIQPCLRMMKTVSLLEITNQIIAVCKADNDSKYLNFLYDQFLVEYPKVEELVDFEVEVLRNI